MPEPREVILRVLQRWVDSNPAPDRPFVGTAGPESELLTPRQILQHVAVNDERGQAIVENWLQMFYEDLLASEHTPSRAAGAREAGSSVW